MVVPTLDHPAHRSHGGWCRLAVLSQDLADGSCVAGRSRLVVAVFDCGPVDGRGPLNP